MIITVPTPNSRSLNGLGNDCPSYAPYINSYGNCTNVAPASPSGGSSAGGNVPSVWTPSPYYNAAAPGAIGTDRSYAEGQARAAEAAGASRGLAVQCQVNEVGSPFATSVWTTDCRWPGAVDSHDAGLLLGPNGFDIALASTQSAIRSGLPLIQPDWLDHPLDDVTFQNWRAATTAITSAPTAPTVSPNAQAQASAATNQPNQSVPPRDTSVSMPTGIPNTGSAFASGLDTISGFAESSGIGTTGLLVAAAAVLFLIMRK